MSGNSESRTPGKGAADWRLFEIKQQTVGGEPKVVGFNEPAGNYYKLGEGEELVQIQTADGMSRDTFIRKDSTDIPFEEWKEGYTDSGAEEV